MTDYAEEKANEIDALKAIYPDEFEEEADDQFQVRILPDDELEDVEPFHVALAVKYTDTYPDALPELKLLCIEGEWSEAEREQLERKMNETAEENVGMAMVFTIASLLKEELNELILARKTEQDRIKEEKLAAELEAEAAKFRGTKVTAENFAAWKDGFDQEMRDLDLKDKAARKAEEAKRGKPTGRQLFEQDKSLAQSDAKFVDDGDVTVDVSQFERELNINDSDDDEENGVAASLFRSAGDD